MTNRSSVCAIGAIALAALLARPAAAQTGAPVVAPGLGAPEPPSGAVAVPPSYVIGPEDVLGVLFWREKDLSGDVAVRPDGKISLPLLNDVMAAGLTPEQLRSRLTEAASKYIADANVTVVVKQINSRKVFITGSVAKPGSYPLTNGTTTVVQLISIAGGLLDYANEKNILIMRSEAGRQTAARFNYRDVLKGKNLQQNIDLKPGDTVVVP